MKKVAVYTLTRDRLRFTKRTFSALGRLGYPFDHYIWDNGSRDGTKEWLKEYMKTSKRRICIMGSDFNLGIGQAKNKLLDVIGNNYDFILKLDNDCEIGSFGILRELVKISEKFKDNAVLSPRVDGLEREIPRYATYKLGNHLVSPVPIVGGIFCFAPAKFYKHFRSDPVYRTRKGDPEFAAHVWRSGGKIYYIDDLRVTHMDTEERQLIIYPEYQDRKEKELLRQFALMKQKKVGGVYELKGMPYWQEVLRYNRSPRNLVLALLYISGLNNFSHQFFSKLMKEVQE